MGDVEALAVEERKALAQAVKAGYDQPRHTLDGTLLVAAVETILAAHVAAARAEERERVREAITVLAAAACVCGGVAACFTCQTADAALLPATREDLRPREGA